MLIAGTVAACLTSLAFVVLGGNDGVVYPDKPVVTPQIPAAGELIDSLLGNPDVPAGADIAFLNLATAPGIPPEKRNRMIGDGLGTLDRWAATVADQTWKNHHRFLKNPSEFGNEAEWRLAMMCTILGQDFGIRYDPSLTAVSQQNATNERFFANPQSVFLTGCLGESRTGTCASLPVLYVAIGRRIGYPMYLVTARSHLFARWDDGKGTLVNIETANSGGFTSHPDSHYRTWPMPITPQEEKAGGYLQNLTPEQELAVFMSTRAICLKAAGKDAAGISAAAAAFRLAPNLGGIVEALQAASGVTKRQNLDELLYHHAMLRSRQSINPMEPVPGIPAPGFQPQGHPSFPHPSFMQAGSMQYPSPNPAPSANLPR